MQDLIKKIKDYENFIETKKQELEQGQKIYSKLQDLLESKDIKSKKLLNKEETKLFAILINIKAKYNLPININPQTPLSAFLSNDNFKDFLLYNTLYVDFLITFYNKNDEINHKPIMVIEYNGIGHYGYDDFKKRRTELNDYIKEILLEKAQIPFLAIKENELESCKEVIESSLEQSLKQYCKDET